MKRNWLGPLLMLVAAPLQGTAAAPIAGGRPISLTEALASRPRLEQDLSVEQAVRIALRESPVIRGAVQEVEAAAGRVAAARAEQRPWASVNTFLGGGSAANLVTSPDPVQPRMTMGLPGDRFVDQNVSLMVPIYTGGRLRAMVQQARALKSASESELAGMRQEVALMVRLGYREVQARQDRVRVYRAMLEQNRERQRVDEVALEVQKIPRYYVLRDQAEVASAQQMVTMAEKEVDVSLIQLKSLMGVHLGSKLLLTEPLSSFSVNPELAGLLSTPAALPEATTNPTLTRLLELAGRHRPELLASEGRIQAGEAELRMGRSAYRPQVSAGVMGDFMKMRGEPSFTGATFAVVGSLPILDGGLRRAKLQTARAEVRKLEEDRQQLALRIGEEVTTALLELRAAEKNVAVARVGAAAAEEDYRVALLRYTSGKGINVEALDALAASVRAQNNQVQALFDYQVAQDRLTRAAGLIEPAGSLK